MSVHFLRNSTDHNHVYAIRDINIKATDEVKYLGLTITSNLSWGTHIRNICGIALKKLGFVKRIVGKFSDEKVKVQSRTRPTAP